MVLFHIVVQDGWPALTASITSTTLQGLLAQRLAQGTHNPWVLGSNPGGPTRFFNRPGNLSGLFSFSSQWFSLTNSLPTHLRAPSVGCARCRRHETGPSTTFNPDPSTIPRISRKPQAVYLRFCFCPRRHGRRISPKRSRWAGFVAGTPGATGVKPDRRATGSAARPRGAPRGLGRASRGPDALDARPHRPRGRWSPPSRPRGTPARAGAERKFFQKCPCIAVRVPV